MKTLCLSLLTLALFAEGPPSIVVWPAAELHRFEKTLAPKMTAEKVAVQQLAQFGNHRTMIAHREGSGQAELHDTEADLFVVQSGTATLVTGGKIAGAKEESPGEIRGTSIEGGAKRKLAAGDIVHIPAKTPHQLLLDSGHQFTYFVLKVKVDTH